MDYLLPMLFLSAILYGFKFGCPTLRCAKGLVTMLFQIHRPGGKKQQCMRFLFFSRLQLTNQHPVVLVGWSCSGGASSYSQYSWASATCAGWESEAATSCRLLRSCGHLPEEIRGPDCYFSGGGIFQSCSSGISKSTMRGSFIHAMFRFDSELPTRRCLDPRRDTLSEDRRWWWWIAWEPCLLTLSPGWFTYGWPGWRTCGEESDGWHIDRVHTWHQTQGCCWRWSACCAWMWGGAYALRAWWGPCFAWPWPGDQPASKENKKKCSPCLGLYAWCAWTFPADWKKRDKETQAEGRNSRSKDNQGQSKGQSRSQGQSLAYQESTESKSQGQSLGKETCCSSQAKGKKTQGTQERGRSGDCHRSQASQCYLTSTSTCLWDFRNYIAFFSVSCADQQCLFQLSNIMLNLAMSFQLSCALYQLRSTAPHGRKPRRMERWGRSAGHLHWRRARSSLASILILVNTMLLILWKHWPATWFENMETWFPLTSKVCGGARSSWFRLCAKASAFLRHVFWGMIYIEISKVGLCHCPSAIVLGFGLWSETLCCSGLAPQCVWCFVPICFQAVFTQRSMQPRFSLELVDVKGKRAGATTCARCSPLRNLESQVCLDTLRRKTHILNRKDPLRGRTSYIYIFVCL